MRICKLLALLMAVCCTAALLCSCERGDDIVVSNSDYISESDYSAIAVSDEHAELVEFVSKFDNAFYQNDIGAFSELVKGDSIHVVSLYGGMGMIEISNPRELDELQIKDGVLLTKADPEVDPPEQEIGFSADMLGDDTPEFVVADDPGFLENIDWSKADYDYMTAHFHAFYDQMAWMCENSAEGEGWVIYKLSNDTYLYSNGYSWYSDEWSSRVFVGQSFVIERDGDNLKIVAFINAK